MSSCPVTRELSRILCFILESNNWIFFKQLLLDKGFKNYKSYEGTNIGRCDYWRSHWLWKQIMMCLFGANFTFDFFTLKVFDHLFCKMFVHLPDIFFYFRHHHQYLQQILVSDSCRWFVWGKLNLNCSSYLHLFMWLNAGN